MTLGTLTLGWQVDRSGHMPRYWQNAQAKPGGQSADDLVQVAGSAIRAHTAIIAQSGSGKSFFLGRLIEELLLETSCRCVILDPNADFRRASDIVPEEHWLEAKYNPVLGRGFLPHEATRDVFASRWMRIPKRFSFGPESRSGNREVLQLSWPLLSAEVIAEDAPSMLRPDLYHCHELVRAIAKLLEMKYEQIVGNTGNAAINAGMQVDLFEKARRILQRLRHEDSQSDKATAITQEIELGDLLRNASN